MARKQTNTADFFPHRVAHGRTIFKLETKYGNDGYAFLFKLCEMLGAAQDHYLNLTDEADWAYFNARMKIPSEVCHQIFTDLVTWGKLDKELWECGRIIWYQNFVDGLAVMYSKRKRPMPEKPNCVLISGTEIPAERDFCTENDDKTHFTGISGSEMPQSRVEESRVEHRREEASSSAKIPEVFFVDRPDPEPILEAEKEKPPGSARPPKEWPRSFSAEELEHLIISGNENSWVQMQKNFSEQVDVPKALRDWCKRNAGENFNDRNHPRNAFRSSLIKLAESGGNKNKLSTRQTGGMTVAQKQEHYGTFDY